MYQPLLKVGHRNKKKENRERIEVRFGKVKYVEESWQSVIKAKQDVIPSLCGSCKTRFASFDEPLFEAMKWLNPANWDIGNPDYGLADLEQIMKHFETTLKASNFEQYNLRLEWRAFKKLVARNYKDVKSTIMLRERIFNYRRSEFKNVYLL